MFQNSLSYVSDALGNDIVGDLQVCVRLHVCRRFYAKEIIYVEFLF